MDWATLHKVKPINLDRASLALLVVAVLATGLVLGSVLPSLRGSEVASTPGPTPASAQASPSADALPPSDVSGEDIARLPRFPGSVRSEYTVTADERFRLTAAEYLAVAALDDVRRFYQGVIVEQGWQRADIGYSGGEWTYVLVDGTTEALIELEVSRGLVEIDLQVSEPIAVPTPSTAPAPAPTAVPMPPPPAAPPQQPLPPGDDDDDDVGDDDVGDDEDGGTDD